jgi:ABC-2 type transport system permease protein
MALFWSLLFPLMFVVVWGLFFGRGSENLGKISFVDKAGNEASYQLRMVLEDSQSVDVEEADWGLEEAKEALKEGRTGFVIIVPENFGNPLSQGEPSSITVVYEIRNQVLNASVLGFLQNYIGRATMERYQIAPLVGIEKVDVTKPNVNYFDFVFVGLLCMALMNSNIIGSAVEMTSFREQKILKRLLTTPLPVWKFMTAQIFSFLLLNLFQLGALLLVGVVIFGAHIHGGYLGVILLALLGALVFLSLGFLVSSFSKTINAASGMANSIAFPMMFLSGVFFATENLPGPVYQVVRFLPLSPMIKAMRNVALEDQPLRSQPFYLLILIAWLLITFVLTVRFFKFGEE